MWPSTLHIVKVYLLAVSSQGIQDRLGAKSANWLAGWLAGWLCCQPRFQFHEVKAVKMRGENCERGCTPISFPSRSAIEMYVIRRYEWLTSVLTPVNEGAYAVQYENKDAEVQTTYT